MSGPPVTTIRQHSERSVPDEAAAIFAAGYVAHVGFVDDGQPYVIPFSYGFDAGDPARIHLHGAVGGRALRAITSGGTVCVEVTLLDGLVYSRTALYHSMNYRSAVAFGRGREVTDPAGKRAILERMIARNFEGRVEGRDYEPSSEAHLATTAVVTIDVERMSAKARRGGPKGPRDGDPTAPGSAGVIEFGHR
jgi:hypothetical protein